LNDNRPVQFGVPLELHIQGLDTQSEQLRRFRLIAAGLPQRCFKQ
jgi:hypothetical protein